MAIDERSRHELFLRLEEALGSASAETLMELLPPVGWADVATKRDLDLLGAQLRAELKADFRGEMNSQLRSIYTAMVATMLGTAALSASLSFAAIELL